MQPESLSKAIQLSVAPVFLLAGIGALMNVLSGRLARIVDNAKQLRLTADAGGEVDELERRLAKRRMQLVIRSIELLTAATLLIAAQLAECKVAKASPPKAKGSSAKAGKDAKKDAAPLELALRTNARTG